MSVAEKEIEVVEGVWKLDADDFLLLAQLADPIFCAELLFEDPLNYDYGGSYVVRDYQFPLFRPTDNYQIWPCGRSLGKTESLKARAVSHTFRRLGEDLLLTAPEMIHLQPLTEAVESRIMSIRLTRDFLKKENQRTGIVRTPAFQVDYVDGTRIFGRIPRSTGQGVKGSHVPDMLMDESQDYPDRGYVEIHEVVMKEHTDSTGTLDFNYHLYGVYAAAQGGTFARLASSGDYKVTAVTAIMRPGWNKNEKAAAAAMYGGTNSPDYRRNILGEAGTGSSQFFVTSRLVAIMEQDQESKYNRLEYRAQEFQVEEVDELIPKDGDVGTLLDLPDNLGQQVYAGMDIGLVTDPTVIMLFAVQRDSEKKLRLKLVRMFHLWRYREPQIRQCVYAIGRKYGLTLRAYGQDITGLGLPMWQTMTSDEKCPDHLREVSRGYVFNAKMAVAVDPNYVSKHGGDMSDQYGNMVEERRNAWTGQIELLTKMTMIEASTRYLRQFIDDGFLWLPFAPLLAKDMQGETEQRVKAMGAAHLKKKPNAFHMLDAMRAMAMAYQAASLEEMVYQGAPGPILDQAVDLRKDSADSLGGQELLEMTL